MKEVKTSLVKFTTFLDLSLFAEHRSSGSSANGRDSKSKRLGIKVVHGSVVKASGIILTQRGTKFFARKNTFLSKNHTIHSYIEGRVKFVKRRYINKKKYRIFVDVLPIK